MSSNRCVVCGDEIAEYNICIACSDELEEHRVESSNAEKIFKRLSRLNKDCTHVRAMTDFYEDLNDDDHPTYFTKDTVFKFKSYKYNDFGMGHNYDIVLECDLGLILMSDSPGAYYISEDRGFWKEFRPVITRGRPKP